MLSNRAFLFHIYNSCGKSCLICQGHRVPRGSVVKCLTRNPGFLGSSLTGSSGFFRGSVLGQDTSEPTIQSINCQGRVEGQSQILRSQKNKMKKKKKKFMSCVFLLIRPFLLYQDQNHLSRSSSNIKVTFKKKNNNNNRSNSIGHN